MVLLLPDASLRGLVGAHEASDGAFELSHALGASARSDNELRSLLYRSPPKMVSNPNRKLSLA